MTKEYYATDVSGITARELINACAEHDGNTPVIIVEGDHWEELEAASSMEAVMAQEWAHNVGGISTSKEAYYNGIRGLHNIYTADGYSDDVVTECEGYGCYSLDDVIDACTCDDVVGILSGNDPGQEADHMRVQVSDSASWAEELAQDPESDDFEPTGWTTKLYDVRYVSNAHYSAIVLCIG